MVESTRVYEIDPTKTTVSGYLGIPDERMKEIMDIARDLFFETQKTSEGNIAPFLVKGSEKLNHPNELAFFVYMLTANVVEQKFKMNGKVHVQEITLDGSKQGLKGMDELIKFLEDLKNKNKPE